MVCQVSTTSVGETDRPADCTWALIGEVQQKQKEGSMIRRITPMQGKATRVVCFTTTSAMSSYLRFPGSHRATEPQSHRATEPQRQPGCAERIFSGVAESPEKQLGNTAVTNAERRSLLGCIKLLILNRRVDGL
jgi:hypothetical protein